MKRRTFLRTTGMAAALGSAGLGLAQDRKRPNLLVIQTDEHNFRTLGCYRKLMPKDRALMWGPTVCETPNIDWLADNGAVATRFYATTPVCSPSRAAFVSGRYPQNNAVLSNSGTLAGNTVTFAEVLRKAGMRPATRASGTSTAMAGPNGHPSASSASPTTATCSITAIGSSSKTRPKARA